MDKAILLDQIDFVQARIEEIDKKVINWKPEDKGYKELVESYNKWIDRYNDMLDKLEHIDDLDVEREKIELEKARLDNEKAKLELEKTKSESMIEIERERIDLEKEKSGNTINIEQKKLDLEKEKLESMQEIEQDKINIDTEKLRLDREKFAYDIDDQKKKDLVEIIFKSTDLGVKILVPTLAIAGTWAVAKLSYMSDAELKLCNGRVAGNVKELLKIATMKV